MASLCRLGTCGLTKLPLWTLCHQHDKQAVLSPTKNICLVPAYLSSYCPLLWSPHSYTSKEPPCSLLHPLSPSPLLHCLVKGASNICAAKSNSATQSARMTKPGAATTSSSLGFQNSCILWVFLFTSCSFSPPQAPIFKQTGIRHWWIFSCPFLLHLPPGDLPSLMAF